MVGYSFFLVNGWQRGKALCFCPRSYIPAAYDALSFFFRLTDTSIKLFMPPAAESVNNKNR